VTQTALHHTDTSDLHIPHGMFRGAFGPAPQIVASVAAGDADRVAAVSTYLDNVLRFLDAHHEGEDAVVWPRLSERCPSQHALIATMESDHTAVHALRTQAGDALAAWSQSPTTPNARRLADAMAALHAKLDAHFADEEREVIPLASANMSPEEWGELPGHAMRHFTGDKLWLVLGLIINQMTAEQRAAILPHMPPPVIEMWNANRAAYDDLLARVRGS
jgi:hemerythrin-like domain-containing protein